MNKLARLEIICGLAWFASDGFWLMQWNWPCYLAGILAVVSGAWIFKLTERRLLLVCCGDSCWLGFNIAWSFGDLNPDLAFMLPWAKILFLVGGVCFAVAYWQSGELGLVLRRLRLLLLLGRKR